MFTYWLICLVVCCLLCSCVHLFGWISPFLGISVGAFCLLRIGFLFNLCNRQRAFCEAIRLRCRLLILNLFQFLWFFRFSSLVHHQVLVALLLASLTMALWIGPEFQFYFDHHLWFTNHHEWVLKKLLNLLSCFLHFDALWECQLSLWLVLSEYYQHLNVGFLFSLALEYSSLDFYSFPTFELIN